MHWYSISNNAMQCLYYCGNVTGDASLRVLSIFIVLATIAQQAWSIDGEFLCEGIGGGSLSPQGEIKQGNVPVSFLMNKTDKLLTISYPGFEKEMFIINGRDDDYEFSLTKNNHSQFMAFYGIGRGLSYWSSVAMYNKFTFSTGVCQPILR